MTDNANKKDDMNSNEKLELIVCIGSSCHLRGSRDVVQILEKLVASKGVGDKVDLSGSFCMGECTSGVCVSVNGKKFSLTPSTTESFFEKEVMGVLNK